jgi:hypothetical protein
MRYSLSVVVRAMPWRHSDILCDDWYPNFDAGESAAWLRGRMVPVLVHMGRVSHNTQKTLQW